MSEQAFRFAFYDQSEDREVADWGGDELFTPLPRRRRTEGEPRRLELVEPRGDRGATDRSTTGPRRDRAAPTTAAALARSAPAAPASESLGPALALVAEPPAPAAVMPIPAGWAPVEREPGGRRTKVITGHPDDRRMPRPRPLTAAAARRRRPPSPAQWLVARPERLVAWAFVLGLLLILIAISTADAATL